MSAGHEELKSGLFVLLEVCGPAGERIHEIQRVYDPRLARLGPPHVTIAGSSGVGPIAPDTPAEALRAALEPVARETPPMIVHFGAPMRFMQSDTVVLPLDPHGPLRALHERIAESLRSNGIRSEPPRFAFTPHCTLSLYRELDAAQRRELLRLRVPEPAEFRTMAVYRTVQYHVQSTKIVELPLGVGPWA